MDCVGGVAVFRVFCAETQSMWQCLSLFSVARVKSVRAFRNSSVSGGPSSHRLALGLCTAIWRLGRRGVTATHVFLPPQRPLVC